MGAIPLPARKRVYSYDQIATLSVRAGLDLLTAAGAQFKNSSGANHFLKGQCYENRQCRWVEEMILLIQSMPISV